MNRSTTRWKLFIDESGSFAATENSLVVGVAFPDLDPLALANLEMTVRETVPEVPWPPHATVCRHDGAWLVWSLRTHTMLTAHAQKLCEELKTLKKLANQALRQLDNGEEPKATYQAISRALKQHASPQDRQVVSQYRGTRRAMLQRLVANFCEVHNGHLFVAATGSTGMPVATDRYLTHQVVLLERIQDVLTTVEGEHDIEGHVATRYVNDPVLPSQQEFNRSHWIWACGQIEGTEATGTPHAVRFKLGSARRYQQGPAALVVADFMANKMFGGLLVDERPDVMVRSLVCDTHGLPHAAATGLARDAVNAARAGREPNLASVKPRWALKQAQQWIQHFERRTP